MVATLTFVGLGSALAWVAQTEWAYGHCVACRFQRHAEDRHVHYRCGIALSPDAYPGPCQPMSDAN